MPCTELAFMQPFMKDRTERQMLAMASAWPLYMQVRICICRRTVSSGKHTEDASRPEAAPSPRLCTVAVLQRPHIASHMVMRCSGGALHEGASDMLTGGQMCGTALPVQILRALRSAGEAAPGCG